MKELSQEQHPNIMNYYGYHQTDNSLYMFFEYYSKGNLKELCQGSTISEFRAIELMKQLFSAMARLNSLSKHSSIQTRSTVT